MVHSAGVMGLRLTVRCTSGLEVVETTERETRVRVIAATMTERETRVRVIAATMPRDEIVTRLEWLAADLTIRRLAV